MGLEAGWNCHISLQSDDNFKPLESSQSQTELVNRFSRHSSRHSSDAAKDKPTNLKSSIKSKTVISLQSRSQSAPSIVNLSSSQVRFDVNDAKMVDENVLEEVCINGKENVFCEIDMNDENDYLISNKDSDGESRHASSYLTENTEDSITGVLDNRVGHCS